MFMNEMKEIVLQQVMIVILKHKIKIQTQKTIWLSKIVLQNETDPMVACGECESQLLNRTERPSQNQVFPTQLATLKP